MSYDLAVWHSSKLQTDTSALDVYCAVVRGDQPDREPSVSLAMFYSALIGVFPELDATATAEIDESPWTAPIDRSDQHVLLPMAWSRARDVLPRVVELAHRYGLTCFDPQAEKIISV